MYSADELAALPRIPHTDGLAVGDRVVVVFFVGDPNYANGGGKVQLGDTGRVLGIAASDAIDFEHDDGRQWNYIYCNRFARCPEDDFVRLLSRTLNA